MPEQEHLTVEAAPQGDEQEASTDLRASITSLVRGASIELATRNLAEIGRCARLLGAGSEVYVPCLPAMPLQHSLSVARRLREHGMKPVPHFAARRLASVEVAAHFLSRLREEAGVRRVLLVAGDNEAAAGPFTSSLALLRSGVLQACGISSVGIAGYPEGHRSIGLRALRQALDSKIEYAQAHGLELFIVSQFCFESRQVLEWLAELRARGVAVPVRVGLTGPCLVRSLLKYGRRCGIGRSLRSVLGARPMSLTRLLDQYGPEQFVRRLAPAAPALGVAGLHFLPFGGFARTVQWLGEVVGGRLELRGLEEGFVLTVPDAGG